MAVAIQTLTRICGNGNLPGTKAKLYLIGKDEILAWPTIGSGATYGIGKTLTTAWSLVTTAGLGYWRQFDILVDTGAVNMQIQGNVGSKYWKPQLEFFIEGMKKEQLQFGDDIVGDSGCLIGMIQLKDGTTLVLGDLENPLFVEAGEGGAKNEAVGIKYTLYYNNGKTPYIYNSGLAIKLTPN
ncbi:MAG: hypothetical protein EBR82_17575 [Caulobacteraceae bacterium]|nr:hypothetical protein [Caulobacteraceae bacterium]